MCFAPSDVLVGSVTPVVVVVNVADEFIMSRTCIREEIARVGAVRVRMRALTLLPAKTGPGLGSRTAQNFVKSIHQGLWC